jgi:hypothetical protein
MSKSKGYECDHCYDGGLLGVRIGDQCRICMRTWKNDAFVRIHSVGHVILTHEVMCGIWHGMLWSEIYRVIDKEERRRGAST